MGRYGRDKQELLDDYQLELEKMCRSCDEIISLEKSEKYLIPDTLIDRAEYLKEEMEAEIEVIDIDKKSKDGVPMFAIELATETEKGYFKGKYFKFIKSVKGSVLDRDSKTHISKFRHKKYMGMAII